VGYAAVRGGLEAIRAAERLVRRARTSGEPGPIGLDRIQRRLGLAVDKVQSEGSLWAPELAARAIRQTEGDLIEASHLVRSYRSTLRHMGSTLPVDMDEMMPVRRIVPAYRTPPGPQLLGHTMDYVGRLIDFDDDPEPEPEPVDAVETRSARMTEVLRSQDLLADRRNHDDPDPVDIVRHPVMTPAPRSARLATLARGETGALVNLWYQSVRGAKAHFHEITLGEVRHGYLPVRVAHPATGEPVELGSLRVTEVEAIEDTDGVDEDRTRFDAGYGVVLGHEERKAIAMAVLDIAIERGDAEFEQSVLQTVDGLDASGFLEHLKLPHYVTFRSIVERKTRLRDTLDETGRPELAMGGPQ
jgi:alpha-D-ribose 1-methylphosphonate 5-triphosphate synthase subunit PhnI